MVLTYMARDDPGGEIQGAVAAPRSLPGVPAAASRSSTASGVVFEDKPLRRGARNPHPPLHQLLGPQGRSSKERRSPTNSARSTPARSIYDVDGIASTGPPWRSTTPTRRSSSSRSTRVSKSVFDSETRKPLYPRKRASRAFPPHDLRRRRNHRHPCMRLVKSSGGHSIAVYNPAQKGARKELASLIHDNRVEPCLPGRLLRRLGDGHPREDHHRQDRPRRPVGKTRSRPLNTMTSTPGKRIYARRWIRPERHRRIPRVDRRTQAYTPQPCGSPWGC